MKSKYKLPAGLPKHACGRCVWWTQTTEEGWGRCALKRDRFWYQCMVCCEYEMVPDISMRQ